MEEKEKRVYERPSVKVVELESRAHLMQTSASRSSYGTAQTYTWP